MTQISRSSADVKAKISLNDTRGDYLENKIVAGPGIAVNKVVDGAGYEQIVVTTEGFEADQFGFHQLECRMVNGCMVPVAYYLLVDHQLKPMKGVDC